MPKSPKRPEARKIVVKPLARVEGEGALRLTMRGAKAEEALLEIFEPPRFYEAFLRGRHFHEVPDIVARICGICPVAYQMSACHALEKALGVCDQIDAHIRRMRNLLYCGEWVESHVLHIFMLHLPDFLGYESSIGMADDRGDLVRRALRIKKAGNRIVEVLGGRSVHPVGVCVGGFYSFPAEERFASLLPEVESALEDMCELTLFLAGELEYPDFEQDYEFVALQPDNEYPMNLGPIASTKGLRAEAEEYLDVVEESQAPHSNALHARIKGRGAYHVGPLARLNLNAEKLHPRAAQLLPQVCDRVGRTLPWRNCFLALPARALEVVHALALAADILRDYRRPDRSRAPVEPRAGQGAHATEAPRGLLWHRYETDSEGLIRSARIVPPTSQNQGQIEADLARIAEKYSHLDDEALCLRCEQTIRNYDPCISCATHFLKLRVERRP